MQPVDPIELAGAPTITLGGKEWKVPAIVPRQNRIITPLVFELMDVFVRAMAAVGQNSMAGFTINTEQYDKLLTICHTAILRAHPEVSRDDMEDWPIQTLELLSALTVVARQAGCLPKLVADPLASDQPAGPTDQPTG